MHAYKLEAKRDSTVHKRHLLIRRRLVFLSLTGSRLTTLVFYYSLDKLIE